MVCLDTDFLIDVIKGKLDERFSSILDGDESIKIASPSIIELIKGLHLERNLRNIKKGEIEKIDKVLNSITVLDLNRESARRAGKIEADLENRGEIIDIEDIMIGAIAIENDEKILTRNKKHFNKIEGLKVEGY